MSEEFQLPAEVALTVVVATVGIYLAFVVLLRVTGPRALAGTSSFDLACVVALGAILGRTVLLAEPTLAIGVVALASFLAMQALLGTLRKHPVLFDLMSRRPVLLVLDGEILGDNMRRAHVVEDELRQVIRRAGAAALADVRCVVLERNGTLSVIRSGELDPWLVADLDVPRR